LARRRWASYGKSGPSPAGRSAKRLPRVVGIAWYREEQWSRLRELEADPDKLHDTYEQWLASIRKTLAALRSEGVLVQKVPLDVDEVAEWCAQRGRPFNGASRSVYVLEALQAKVSSGERRRTTEWRGKVGPAVARARRETR
jgi:hypothetical protein